MEENIIRIFASNNFNVASLLPYKPGNTIDIAEFTGVDLVDPKQKESLSEAYNRQDFMVINIPYGDKSIFNEQSHTYSLGDISSLLEADSPLELKVYSRKNEIVDPKSGNLTIEEIKATGNALKLDDSQLLHLLFTYQVYAGTEEFQYLLNQK